VRSLCPEGALETFHRKEETMKMKNMKTLLAVLALALGLAGQASAQAPTFRRPQPTKPTTKQPAGSVKVTDAPAEATPAPDAAAAAPAATAPGTGMAQGSPTREETAITVARDWLATVDSGNFGASYDQAGELFRGNTPREQWQAGLEGSRRSVGPLAERSLKSVLVTKDLPNAPAGKYVVTTFETKFQAPQPMWEILTTYLNPNGQWKVVGYQIKPQDAGAQAKQPQK
jgi:Protein of unknown function (DUF4019)